MKSILNNIDNSIIENYYDYYMNLQGTEIN